MTHSENVSLILSQLDKIKNQDKWNYFQKNKSLFELFTLILEESTSVERLHFTTLFSRLAYVGTKHGLPTRILHLSHVYRKAHEKGEITKESEEHFFHLGVYVCTVLLHTIFDIAFDKKDLILEENIELLFKKNDRKFIGFRTKIEAVLFEINSENKTLLFYDEDDPDVEKLALYDVHDKNEIFNQNIDSLLHTFTLPIHINLIDVDIRDDGYYIPAAFVVSPDHLFDVTSISECFKDFGAEPFLYLISKFKPSESTAPLLTGNLVNFLLDELISDTNIEFSNILPSIFRANPLAFALLDDLEVRDLLQKLQQHFEVLKTTIANEFKKLEIDRDNIFLEPSFYSRDFGIQGRLDLLHEKTGKRAYDIIELKSGKTFKPNVYGINASHYVQTLLYDLMIKSAFQTKSRSFNYILYSKEKDKPLRFAPPVRAQQYEALKLRNDLMAIEQKLASTKEDDSLLQYIKLENFPKLRGFNSKDIENFNNIYSTLDIVEKSYFIHFTSFIAKEQAMAKTGEHGINKSNGHSSLWLESPEDKRDRFALLSKLKIIDNQSLHTDAYLTFLRDEGEFTLVNFRKGDIAVLYPDDKDGAQSILRNQIFKCTITEVHLKSVTVKLRNKQYNQSLFTNTEFWSLELDSLDSGFNAMYKSLMEWAAAPIEYRKLFLGRKIPDKIVTDVEILSDEGMTQEQKTLLTKVLGSKHYFLLWGPPGSGKTSIMVKNIVKHLYFHTKENILLLAYTNRAVDEICEAISSFLKDQSHFLRIGSRLGTDDRYTAQLLDQAIKQLNTRSEILDFLNQNRIWVSTVSSILSKTELFQIKNFDTVIIDEASQILEPMLAGLLSRFKKFILIGDHKQLPAVVIQKNWDSQVTEDLLLELGWTNTRTSLFERLYHQLKTNEVDHAFGILSQQGRMHLDIMQFPNQYFYENKLQCLPGLERQGSTTFFKTCSQQFAYLQNRKVFLDTPEDQELNWKTNIHEAKECVRTIENLIELYHQNGMNLTSSSIGIITPYRAQIALLKKCMEILPSSIVEKISVDTVERYQGSARDIIIISFCVNRLSQLDALISLSQEGIDRKLNVALTRAKEHIILIGNKALLSTNEVYSQLILHYEQPNQV